MKLLYPVLLMLLAQALLSQDRIVEAYPEVFDKAAREQKNVFFIFSHERCGWCRVFDMYHETPEVKEILEKDYLFEIIDITDSEPLTELWKHCGFTGVPSSLIYSPGKELLFDGKTEEGNPVGYPLSPGSMDAYINAIRESSTRISEKQLKVLRKKIVYCDKHF
jgi:hypothetical protein